MSHRVIPPATYVDICVILVALTFVTAGVSFIPLPGIGHVVAGLTIGLIKASLVVLFFMHVIHSDRIVWLTILFGCVGLGILFVLSFGDYFTRGMLPFVPGH